MHPTSPVAPDWLTVPDDPNDLVSGLWPESAHRDEKGALVIAGATAERLAEQFGTPLFVIDEGEYRTRARRIRDAFQHVASAGGTRARVYYAGKSFLSVAVASWAYEEGLGVDVCTRGELETALAAGVPAAQIGFHGNNKSFAELQRAVEVGVGTIIVDSDDEIDRLATLLGDGGDQGVLLRVNSGVHAETHSFLATAHEDQKFGFPLGAAEAAVAKLRRIPGVRFLGLHCHIGSQIFGVDGFRESASRLLDVHAALRKGGEVPLLNLGGGFGVAYTRADDPTDIEVLAEGIVTAVVEGCRKRNIPLPELAFEPGRWISGPSGVTLYEIGTTKDVTLDDGQIRRYLSVDGGMSDNARPALYGAQYSARLAGRAGAERAVLARVVGKHCESGDIVVEYEYLPADAAVGDLLAVPVTGAYCHSLASNYNHVPRPAIIAVRDGEAKEIVRRETLDDVLKRDLGAHAGAEKKDEGAR